MSRTVIKIETGAIGIILIFILISSGFVRSDESVQMGRVRYYGGKVSPRVKDMLQVMHADIQNTFVLHMAEPNRLLFENNQGDLFEYSYAYQAIWCNGDPVLMNIDSFHFEYRNKAGHALCQYNSDVMDICTVMFIMQYQKENQNIVANGRVRIQPCYTSFHEPSEQGILLVDSQ